MDSAVEDGWERVLVIANVGLENPALCAEVCRRGDRERTRAMVFAPIVASSWLHELTDDVDPELDAAQARVVVALETLTSLGIQASGQATRGRSIDALIDGLRQFQATEVVMLRGGERGWDDPDAIVERVRAELGVPVTEVDPVSSDAAPH